LHPKLIKANIALYNGSRVEARRLLDEYLQESGKTLPSQAAEIQSGKSKIKVPVANEAESHVMWIDAQAQDSREDRIKRMQALIEFAPPNDPYVKMARQALEQEQKFAPEEEESPEIPGESKSRIPREIVGVPMAKALGFLGVGFAVGLIALLALGIGGTPARQVVASNVVTDFAPTQVALAATLPPSREIRIDPNTHRLEYPRARLEIVASEDYSERVVEVRSGEPLQAVQGARFYALKLIFTCREGICNQPPEAALSLLTDDSDVLPMIRGAGIAGETILEPVGLGSSTTGWVVFELPQNSNPNALVITPPVEGNQTPQPQLISLVDTLPTLEDLLGESAPQPAVDVTAAPVEAPVETQETTP
jgi:hypothetical protein